MPGDKFGVITLIAAENKYGAVNQEPALIRYDEGEDGWLVYLDPSAIQWEKDFGHYTMKLDLNQCPKGLADSLRTVMKNVFWVNGQVPSREEIILFLMRKFYPVDEASIQISEGGIWYRNKGTAGERFFLPDPTKNMNEAYRFLAAYTDMRYMDANMRRFDYSITHGLFYDSSGKSEFKNQVSIWPANQSDKYAVIGISKELPDAICRALYAAIQRFTKINHCEGEL
jgi:hypothetical protein